MSNNRNRPTYIGNKTDSELEKIKIMLRWRRYGQEEYSVNELLAQGYLSFQDIQAIADLEGDSWKVPESRKSSYFDAHWAFVTYLEGVVGEEEEEEEEEESDFSYELRSEAFARGGMQAVNDLHCSSEVDDFWR